MSFHILNCSSYQRGIGLSLASTSGGLRAWTANSNQAFSRLMIAGTIGRSGPKPIVSIKSKSTPLRKYLSLDAKH